MLPAFPSWALQRCLESGPRFLERLKDQQAHVEVKQRAQKLLQLARRSAVRAKAHCLQTKVRQPCQLQVASKDVSADRIVRRLGRS